MLEDIQIEEYGQLIIDKIENYLLVWSNLIELVIFIFMIAAAYFLSKILYKHVDELLDKIKALKQRKKD